MSLQELQNYTFTAKYAKWNSELKRRENWFEAVSRVENMMLDFYKNKNIEDDIKNAYSAWKNKLCVGSQRSLQFGGPPVLKHNARQYNCCASYCDRLRFFQECMYLLMCGCGTGFSVQKHHINKLPKLYKSSQQNKIFIIEDSIEGWSDAIGVLISSYFENGNPHPEYKNTTVDFDYSKIRPAGSNLSSSSAGKAPGPEPLKRSIEKIKDILDLRVSLGFLRPIDAYDITMHLSDAVLSGGIRRSATICIFSKDDEEMYNAKTGDWFYKNPQRGRSNNSAMLIRNETSFEEFQKIIESTKNYGEPGFIWSDSTEQLFNPCVEASLTGYDEDGNSGWQFCNLSSINGKKVKSLEDFLIAVEAAATIGTLQAGFLSFPYLGKVTENITAKESLLGISITGIMDNPDILLNPENQKLAAEKAKQVNEKLAKKLGINPAARLTNIKPEGTTSCVLGTASGIHPHHAKRYIRRVQANKFEEVYQYFKKYNPKACESSVWSNNNSDDVISFCIEVEDGAKTKNQVSAIDLLQNVMLTQQNWVKYGTVKSRLAAPYLQHNVSNTINVKPEEWEPVTKFIYDNRKWFAGISILPVTGDKDYPQAPFTTVYLPNEMVRHYGDGIMFVSGLIEKALELWEDNLWVACDSLIMNSNIKGKAKQDWIQRCEKFAMKYFGGELKKLTYAMKDVYNYKSWTELKLSYNKVDYSKLLELTDNTKVIDQIACAGGKCEF